MRRKRSLDRRTNHEEEDKKVGEGLADDDMWPLTSIPQAAAYFYRGNARRDN